MNMFCRCHCHEEGGWANMNDYVACTDCDCSGESRVKVGGD